MAVHTQAEFENFIKTLRRTNRTLNYFFCDFEKIKANVNKVKLHLNTLNALLTSTNIKQTIDLIFDEYGAKPFSALEILLATRDSKKDEVYVVHQSTKDDPKLLYKMFETPQGVYEFLEETKMLSLFQDKYITNLVDYVFGVETGLDSNARKNRSGNIMESECEALLINAGVKYQKQVKSTKLPELTKILGKDIKKFDFVIYAKDKTYVVEVNFYNGGGSKPNEVARAYTGIAPKINATGKYEFLWVTDGYGWYSAGPEIRQAYDTIPCLFNLTTFEQFLQTL